MGESLRAGHSKPGVIRDGPFDAATTRVTVPVVDTMESRLRHEENPWGTHLSRKSSRARDR